MEYKELKLSNGQLELALELLKPILPHRDKVGYISARNTRIIQNSLTEYFQFKQDLIKKYGDIDVDEQGKALSTISIFENSPNFEVFNEEFSPIRDLEQTINIMTMSYDEIVGILNGTEILNLEFMLTD